MSLGPGRPVGTMSGFLSPELTAGLRRNLLQKEEGMMHPAGIGKHFDFQRNLEIRGDVICWIEEDTDDPFEQEFLDQMRRFVEHLNPTCYTGIRSFEFHYALYEAGSFTSVIKTSSSRTEVGNSSGTLSE